MDIDSDIAVSINWGYSKGILTPIFLEPVVSTLDLRVGSCRQSTWGSAGRRALWPLGSRLICDTVDGSCMLLQPFKGPLQSHYRFLNAGGSS